MALITFRTAIEGVDVLALVMQGYTPFKTAIEGVEVLALVEYIPSGEDERGRYNHDASIEYVIHAGADILLLLSKGVIETIRERFLAEMEAGE